MTYPSDLILTWSHPETLFPNKVTIHSTRIKTQYIFWGTQFNPKHLLLTKHWIQNTHCEAQSPPSRSPQQMTLPHKCNETHRYVRGITGQQWFLWGSKAFQGMKSELGFEGWVGIRGGKTEVARAIKQYSSCRKLLKCSSLPCLYTVDPHLWNSPTSGTL